MKLSVQDIILHSLSPNGEDERTRVIQEVLARYDNKRKWYNTQYLLLGLKEHKRLLGVYPVRDAMAAWLYHAFEPGDELTSSVAFLRDSRALGFTFDEAESYIIPLIRNSHPSLASSSVVGDMRLAILGQKRIPYLSYARKIKLAWKALGIEGEAWRLGRIAMLAALMARKRIYFRDEFEKALATPARENMQAELDLLGYTPPPPPPPEPTPMPTDCIIVLNPGQPPVKLSDIIKKTEEKQGDKPNEVPPSGPSNPPPPTEGGTPGPVPSDRGDN